MIQNFRAVLKFNTYSPSALKEYAIGISVIFTEPIFSACPLTELDFVNAINDFSDAITAWGPKGQRGSHAQHLTLLATRKIVEENIRAVSNFVNIVASGSADVIALANMVANAIPQEYGVLPAPQNVRSPYSVHTISGQCRIRWNKVPGAHSYIVYSSATVDGPFVDIGTSTKTLFISNGIAGRRAYYTIRAVGKSGVGVESDILLGFNKE